MSLTQNEEQKTAEKLIAEAGKDGGLQDLENEEKSERIETPVQEEHAEATAGVEAPKAGETAEQKQEVVDYMAQAIERAKLELKHKTDLSDAEVNTYIAQRFLTAGKRIQREVEARKAVEQALGDVDQKTIVPLRNYYRDMEQNPIVQAVRAGKNFKVIDGKVYEVAEDGEIEEQTPEMKKLATLEQKLEGVLTAAERERAEAQKQKSLDHQTTEQKEIERRITKEEELLCVKYPAFKTWLEQSKSLNYPTPELEEILDTVQKDGVTLTYAVKAYFADHGLPSVIKKAKDDAVNELKNKAGQTSERGAAAGETKRQIKYHDEGDLAEALVASAGF